MDCTIQDKLGTASLFLLFARLATAVRRSYPTRQWLHLNGVAQMATELLTHCACFGPRKEALLADVAAAKLSSCSHYPF